jgi:hypothetical protein
VPKYGLSGNQIFEREDVLPEMLCEAEAALARGNIGHVEFHVDDVLEAFHIRLDRECEAYRRLGMEILRQNVLALRAFQQRSKGEPIPSPKLPIVGTQAAASGDTLQAAFAGWKKARNPAPGTLAEYDRAIRLFTELHGDMPVASIGRRHARTFVEALQDVPRKRTGNPQRWRDCARNLRAGAERAKGGPQKRTLLRIAETCERLAKKMEQQSKKSKTPN